MNLFCYSFFQVVVRHSTVLDPFKKQFMQFQIGCSGPGATIPSPRFTLRMEPGMNTTEAL